MSEAIKEPSWHAAFPTPTCKPDLITVEELHKLVLAAKPLSYLVVDVRRTDFEDACVKGAINLSAQSFYQTAPALLPLLSRYEQVIFHCTSSNGRGPRTAGWYGDALKEAGIVSSRAVVLVGGIKAWREAYGEDKSLTSKL